MCGDSKSQPESEVLSFFFHRLMIFFSISDGVKLFEIAFLYLDL